LGSTETVVDYPPPPPTRSAPHISERLRLSGAVAVGAVAAVATAFTSPWQATPLLFWIGASLTWTASIWLTVLPLDAAAASRYATREDPHGATANTLLLSASVAALGAVILGILKASHLSGGGKVLLLASGIGAIVCSWGVVHTVFTLRYAGLYYDGPDGGVNFNDDEKPVYADFAYLAFTIGMTYQVSDTDLTAKAIRHTALRHALLSYLLGTVIIAATINLAAGLAK
jgi:uncharacterized membrane protein